MSKLEVKVWKRNGKVTKGEENNLVRKLVKKGLKTC